MCTRVQVICWWSSRLLAFGSYRRACLPGFHPSGSPTLRSPITVARPQRILTAFRRTVAGSI